MSRSARRATLAATILGSSIAFLDTMVVVIALPSIAEDLGMGLAGQQWVLLAYSLTLVALYLVAGAVGDRRGHRRRPQPPSGPGRSPTRSTGSGLRGMRERVTLLGGDLRAGPEGDGWRVLARMPLPGGSCAPAFLRRIPGLS